MATAIAVRQKRTTAESMVSSLTTAKVIERYDSLPKQLAIEETSLYRELVGKIDNGDASDEEKQAAELLSGKHGWHMDSDLRVIKRLRRFTENYPDPSQFQVESEKRIAELREQIADASSKLQTVQAEFNQLGYRLAAMNTDRAEQELVRERSSHLFA